MATVKLQRRRGPADLPESQARPVGESRPAVERPLPDRSEMPREPREEEVRAEKPQPAMEPGQFAQAPASPAVDAPKRAGGRKRLITTVAGIAALIAAAWYGYDYLAVGRYIVSTDDAYVGAYMSLVSPKIAANVVEVRIVDNQPVKAGDVLIRLDDGDFRLTVEQAAARTATQHATVETFDAQIRSAQASAAQARAQLAAAEATLARSEADFSRSSALAQRSVTSQAALDAARATRDSAKAQVAAQQAAIQTADANIAVLQAQKIQSERALKELEVAQAKAERDLSFTLIRAPFDGVVGNKSVQVGDYVTPGKRMAAVVPLDQVFVDANLKETQLARVAPGQKVRVRVDALGGRAIEGTVQSLAPASGSQFSLLPPENATGNFTKIVQRVPVRVAVTAKDALGKLRPGLSVVVDIDTRTPAQSPEPRTASSADEPRPSK